MNEEVHAAFTFAPCNNDEFRCLHRQSNMLRSCIYIQDANLLREGGHIPGLSSVIGTSPKLNLWFARVQSVYAGKCTFIGADVGHGCGRGRASSGELSGNQQTELTVPTIRIRRELRPCEAPSCFAHGHAGSGNADRSSDHTHLGEIYCARTE